MVARIRATTHTQYGRQERITTYLAKDTEKRILEIPPFTDVLGCQHLPRYHM